MEIKKIALIGNPNTGKSSLFNLLTGLNQRVGNFPGITVDKKTGTFDLSPNSRVQVLDLPGTYSLFPRSQDERVVFDVLSNPSHPEHPDLVVAVADASNLERNLFLFTQIHDLGLPVVLVLTMEDVTEDKVATADIPRLSRSLGNVPIFMVNGRTGAGLESLKTGLLQYEVPAGRSPFVEGDLRSMIGNRDEQISNARDRFLFLKRILPAVRHTPGGNVFTSRLDRILVHPFFGYAIFVFLLLIMFQLVFHIAAYPMNWIDGAFLNMSRWVSGSLPPGVFTDLIAEGLIPGIGGVVVFIPQIALLFLCISLLEESGYMARVVFIMDRLVRPFGLSGRSVVPLLGSAACAIPGVMATRNIGSWRERMITILVAPLMSCSARIPVFMLLITLVIPNTSVLGFIDLRGLVLFSLYTLGLVSALLAALVFRVLLHSEGRSFLLMELPVYQLPRWNYVMLTVWEKVRVFTMDAGKIILAISVILWALASYGPSGRMAAARLELEPLQATMGVEEFGYRVQASKLENSYIGMFGQFLEPVIKPLGYDWKIGIALVTSFAAREVFVGSMATIYSVGENFDSSDRLVERMRREKNPATGENIYTVASGVSLMVFYVYAMQCMATFAVVKRETRSIKWPLIQMIYMGVLAYLGAFITYQILS